MFTSCCTGEGDDLTLGTMTGDDAWTLHLHQDLQSTGYPRQRSQSHPQNNDPPTGPRDL